MTTTIEIDTSKGILGMSQVEKDAFIDIMDLAYDYGVVNDVTDEDIALYKAILQERHDKKRGEIY